ncbi:MAG: hypothetical protein ILP18_00060 [Treponema sp.]|nr:hypothetical protein [Treponema sp.]
MIKLKNIFLVALLAFGAVLTATGLPTSSSGKFRAEIDAFLAEYEEFVMKAEAAAQKKEDATFDMSHESLELAEKGGAMEDTDDWTLSDATKYMELLGRYAVAAAKVSDSTEEIDLDNFYLSGFAF